MAITLEEAQGLEHAAPLRLKFASLSDHGELQADANLDYPPFFAGLPEEGWTLTQLGLIETRTESAREAWELSDGQFGLVAVEHETGIELILIPILVGVAAPLLTDAICECRTGWSGTGWSGWSWSCRSVRDSRSNWPASAVSFR